MADQLSRQPRRSRVSVESSDDDFLPLLPVSVRPVLSMVPVVSYPRILAVNIVSVTVPLTVNQILLTMLYPLPVIAPASLPNAQSIGLSQPDISCGKPVKCKIQPMPRPLCVEEPLPPALIDAAMTHAEPIKAMLTAFSAQCI